MKKSVLFFIALSISTALFAQQPFGKNATWVVEYQNEYGFEGFRKISYTHDTIINGESWQKFSLSGVSHLRTGPNPNDVIQSRFSGLVFSKIFLTRNDSVFIKNTFTGADEYIYDFSAGIGAKWQFADWDTTLGCVDTPQVTVMAIGYDTINGVPLKYWDLLDNQDSIFTPFLNWYGCSSAQCMGGRMYERFGMAVNNFKPYGNACNGMILELPIYRLRCYQDDSISVNFTNSPCDAWPWLDVEENNALSNIKIYPNPATNYLRLSGMKNLNKELDWKIIDLSGRVLLNGKLDNETKKISIQNLSGGMYILELNGRKSLRFLKD